MLKSIFLDNLCDSHQIYSFMHNVYHAIREFYS